MSTRRHIHEKLGLSFQEYGALLATREMLKRKDIVHITQEGGQNGKAHVFNMNHTGSKNDACGTISCIGGTMAFIMGENPDNYVSTGGLNLGLQELFFPDYDRKKGGHSHDILYETISAKQAVKAIDNYLKYGSPRWRSILSRRQYHK